MELRPKKPQGWGLLGCLLPWLSAAQLGQVPSGGLPNSLMGGLGAVQFPPTNAGGLGALGGFPQGGLGLGGGTGGSNSGLQGNLEAPPDLACTLGSSSMSWGAAKQRFRDIFAVAPPWLPAGKPNLSQAMENGLQILKSHGALSPQVADECGLGKLCLQLMAFTVVEDPTALVQLFSSYEPLASPVLTMLLDIPWVEIAKSGWPIFGLLAQINLRKAETPEALNTPELDGLGDPAAQQFQAELAAALEASDGPGVERAASSFLQKDAAANALAPLTALAAQALAVSDGQARAEYLKAMQIGVRQAIGNAGELDVALSTNWPLWGLLHAAVDSLFA